VAELAELVFLGAGSFGNDLGKGCGSQESRAEIKAGITRDIGGWLTRPTVNASRGGKTILFFGRFPRF